MRDIDKRVAEDKRRIKEYEKAIARIPLQMLAVALVLLLLIWLFLGGTK